MSCLPTKQRGLCISGYCEELHAFGDRISRAFSSEVDTGSREENASKRKSGRRGGGGAGGNFSGASGVCPGRIPVRLRDEIGDCPAAGIEADSDAGNRRQWRGDARSVGQVRQGPVLVR